MRSSAAGADTSRIAFTSNITCRAVGRAKAETSDINIAASAAFNSSFLLFFLSAILRASMQSPEELARENIDKLLTKCGWIIQNYKQLNLSAGRGIAIREVPLKKGRCDYLLLIDRKPIGIVEAKKAGVTLSTVADQSGSLRKESSGFSCGEFNRQLPFLYESTGIETFFRDERDPHPRSRQRLRFSSSGDTGEVDRRT